jgi:class 3 adenylate cyclase
MKEAWGTSELTRFANPSRADDHEFLERGASISRASATPRSVAEYLTRTISLDVRDILPLIKAPTLVLHTKDNTFTPVELGRFVADNIEGARFLELKGRDTWLGGDSSDSAIEEIAEFLTGHRPVEVERVLATVLFTDIVDSTSTASALGDRRWRLLLDEHDNVVRDQLRVFRGREVKTTGDGFVASFDGPARAIRCSQAILHATKEVGIDVRAGLHTGECEVRDDDLGGLAVHIAARVGAMARPDEVLVSGTVKDLVVGSGIEFEDRGEHELKGVPGSWRLFSVRG